MNEQKKIMEEIPFANYTGIELLESKQGYARGRMALKPELTNPYGGMHGGCIYTLADTIAGVAAVSYGTYVTTVDSDMHYLQVVKDCEHVYCEANVVRHGASITVCNAEIRDDRENLCATATFTYYNLKQKI
ncbi:MAG: PaaI family thioesterase [Wujia sp.]